jgi:hypothetical protein
MKKSLFVSLEIARKLKEKSFDEPCMAYYKNDFDDFVKCEIPTKNSEHGFSIALPIHQQVIDWFKKKHNIYIIEQLDMTCDPKYCYEIYKYEYFGNWELVSKRPDMFLYLDPVENLNTAIEEALELIENNKKQDESN